MAREDGPLLERAGELAAIAARVEAARGGAGGLLLIEGVAGIGKTRLLRAGCERAAAADMAVLTARGGELERGWPYGVMRGLFESLVAGARPADRDVLLAGAAALAAPVLGIAPRGGAPASDGGAFGVVHGLYWLTVNLTDRAPLLLAIDDAHWADQASMRFALHLLRRLEALPVLLVVAARPDEPGVDHTHLEVLRADPLTTTLHPAALTEPAAAAVVRAALPLADPGLCRACHAATGGNPLLLRMLSRALRDDGADPTISAGQRIAELAPQVVAATLRPRLRRLPEDVTRFAGAVAVLGDHVQLRHAAALAALEIGPATRATDTLATAGILAPGRPIEFIHPTVRRAIYDELPTAERHRAHRLAAELLDAEHAPADQVAAHLVVTERLGDGWVVQVLRAAARQALTRGAVEEATRYLRRALDEPPAPRARAEVLFELGSATARTRIGRRTGIWSRRCNSPAKCGSAPRSPSSSPGSWAPPATPAAPSRCSTAPSLKSPTSTRPCGRGSRPSTSASPAATPPPEGKPPGGCTCWPSAPSPAV